MKKMFLLFAMCIFNAVNIRAVPIITIRNLSGQKVAVEYPTYVFVNGKKVRKIISRDVMPAELVEAELPSTGSEDFIEIYYLNTFKNISIDSTYLKKTFYVLPG